MENNTLSKIPLSNCQITVGDYSHQQLPMLRSVKEPLGIRGYLLAFCVFALFIAIYHPILKSGYAGLSELNVIIYVLILLAAHQVMIKHEEISINTLDYLILLYVIYCFFSIFYTCYLYNLESSIVIIRYKAYLNQFIIYFLLKNSIHNKRQARLLITSFTIILIIGAIISLIAFLLWPDLFARGGTRLKGLVNQPGLYGLFIVILSPFLFLTFKPDNKVQKLIKLVSIVIVMFALFMTGSRGAFVAQFVVLFSIFFQSRHKLRIIISSVLAVTLIVAIVHFGPFQVTAIQDRLTLDGTHDLNTYSSGRWGRWKRLLSRTMEAPIIGHGFDSVRKAGFKDATHNEYLGMFFELGLVGLSLKILIFSHIWLLFKKNGILILANAARYSLTGYLVCIFFINPGSPYFLWMAIAVSVRYIDLHRSIH